MPKIVSSQSLPIPVPSSMGGTGQSTLSGFLQWVKVSKTFTDLATAGVTNNITLYSLPAKSLVHCVVLKASAAFTGGAIVTYTLSVGIAGSLTKYTAAFDVLQTVGATVSLLTVPVTVVAVESFTTAVDLKLSAVSTVGNLDEATTGAVDVYLLTSTLP